jgi:hypothetical protein
VAGHPARYRQAVPQSTNYQGGITAVEVATMKTRTDKGQPISPSRLLEMLEFRFGVFKALAYAACDLFDSDSSPDSDPPMDRLTARALLEFGDDLQQAYQASIEWLQDHPSAIQEDLRTHWRER